VHIHWIKNEKDLERFPLRGQLKKKGEKGYRIVEIDNFDYSPCGGTHLKNTGDLRVFKILRWNRVKDCIKMEFVVGDRALHDYTEKHRILDETTAFLGIRESDLPQTVSKLQQDLRTRSQEIENLWDRITTLEMRSILAAASVRGKYRIITHMTQDRNLEELLYLEKKLADNSNCVVFLGNILTMEQKVQLIFGRSPSWETTQYDQKELHMGQLVREIALQLKGKGGGKPEFAQGSGEFDGQHPDALKKVFEKLNQKIVDILSK
jgi:alanyl-tRNA synthetase